MIRKGKRWDPDRLEALGRFLLLIMIGMFTGYTLVSLFGLIIGGALSFAVVWYFMKVMNRSDTDPAGTGRGTTASGAGAGLGIFSPRRLRLRYRCLSCYHTYAGNRECPRCGSRMKHAEF